LGGVTEGEGDEETRQKKETRPEDRKPLQKAKGGGDDPDRKDRVCRQSGHKKRGEGIEEKLRKGPKELSQRTPKYHQRY